MNVTFYTFNKRVNSTLRPSEEGLTFHCALKDDTSVTEPKLEVKLANIPTYNYCFLTEFNRYYFITDWQYYRGVWTASLTEDYLGTWKSAIVNTSAFVAYSTSHGSKDIVDTRTATSCDVTTVSQEQLASDSIFTSVGCYLLTLISEDSNGMNGVGAVYAMTTSQLQAFMDLITSTSWLDAFITALGNALVNPMDAIISCKWVPFSYYQLDGNEVNIKVMFQETDKVGKLLIHNVVRKTVTFNLPTIGSVIDYRDSSAYSTGVLYLPFVGTVPLDLDAFYPNRTLYINITADVVGGEVCYTISNATDRILSTYSATCATSVPVSNTDVASMGVTAGVMTMIGGYIVEAAIGTGAAAAKGLATALSGMFAATNSAKITTQTNGQLSSRCGAYVSTEISLAIIRKTPTDLTEERNRKYGRPCAKTLTLTALSGYCQTVGASVSMEALQSEIDEVNNMLDQGFYLE